MSDNCKLNIYVNSINRRQDETPSNFNVIIPDGLLKVNSDEEFELNVISFNCYNTFYHCNNNSNKFQMIFRNDLGFIYAFQDLFLINGNPNIYDILSNINTLSTIYFTTSYNRISNKFTFTRIYTRTTDYYNMYIQPFNNSNFLGLSNDVEFLSFI